MTEGDSRRADPAPTVAAGDPERPAVSEVLGGPLGLAESALPPVTFITAYTVGAEPTPAALVALAVGAVMAVGRIARGQTVQYAFAGLVGVGLAAFIVSRTGRAEDFFLPGLLANAAYGLGCAISIAVGRPAVGLVLGFLTGEGTGWRSDPALVRAYGRATWIWVGVFGLRLSVQLPLYLAGAVVALGTARVAMGVPIFLLALWLTWLLLRTQPGALPGASGSSP